MELLHAEDVGGLDTGELSTRVCPSNALNADTPWAVLLRGYLHTVTTLFLDLDYCKIDIIDNLLPPSRHPNLTMRIQRHAVSAWLSLKDIATDSTAVAVGTCLFGAYFRTCRGLLFVPILS